MVGIYGRFGTYFSRTIGADCFFHTKAIFCYTADSMCGSFEFSQILLCIDFPSFVPQLSNLPPLLVPPLILH